jgi:hypothetical protein
VYFDGKLMTPVSEYQGVPEDSTLSAFSLIYVPIGGNLMRPYERRRSGELAGTTGSRTPSWPVQTKTSDVLVSPPQNIRETDAVAVVGFPVYRRRGLDPRRIFVAVMLDGPVAPFVRR